MQFDKGIVGQEFVECPEQIPLVISSSPIWKSTHLCDDDDDDYKGRMILIITTTLQYTNNNNNNLN